MVGDGCSHPGKRQAVGLTGSGWGGEGLEIPWTFPLSGTGAVQVQICFHNSKFLGSHQVGEEHQGGLALSLHNPCPFGGLGQSSMLLESLSHGVKF